MDVDKESREEIRGKHWTELLAEQLKKEKKPPYSITGGMTTSGPAHLGTICEFLYPYTIQQTLIGNGEKAEFWFIGDILDAFDGIPLEMQKYKDVLAPELGKPLVYTKDPEGCHGSYGDHYLEQAKALMKWLNAEIKVLKVNELYDAGRFDPYTRIYLDNEDRVREIVAETSLRKVEDLKEWSPIMPICQKCGRIATTRVLSHKGDEYEYACDRDAKYVKGCGYKGKAKITDHKYKLQWRLHWPSWQAIFNSSIEGSGMDHMTRGGSATTAPVIHKEILKRDSPILFKYGFIFVNGHKPSKSKGIGMGALELSRLIPPEMLRYVLVAQDIQRNKDIDLTGDKLIVVYNDLERISTLKQPDNRADEKNMLAFRIAVKRLPWKASFVDMLLNYQIYRNWKRVGELLNDTEGVEYLSPYIESWLAKGYAPERYDFTVRQSKITTNIKEIKELISRLKPGMADLEVHTLIYEIAKEHNVKADELFTSIYKAIIGKEKGPRAGKLLVSIGIEKAKEMLSYSIS
jgi:lysyl-tRNA synthetase, class I